MNKKDQPINKQNQPKFCFIGSQDCTKYLICPICQELMIRPMRIHPCAHTFCQNCLEPSSRHCPISICHRNVQIIQNDRTAQSLIDELKVECKNDGCVWKGCYDNYKKSHQNSCILKNGLNEWLQQLTKGISLKHRQKQQGSNNESKQSNISSDCRQNDSNPLQNPQNYPQESKLSYREQKILLQSQKNEQKQYKQEYESQIKYQQNQQSNWQQIQEQRRHAPYRTYPIQKEQQKQSFKQKGQSIKTNSSVGQLIKHEYKPEEEQQPGYFQWLKGYFYPRQIKQTYEGDSHFNKQKDYQNKQKIQESKQYKNKSNLQQKQYQQKPIIFNQNKRVNSQTLPISITPSINRNSKTNNRLTRSSSSNRNHQSIPFGPTIEEQMLQSDRQIKQVRHKQIKKFNR